MAAAFTSLCWSLKSLEISFGVVSVFVTKEAPQMAKPQHLRSGSSWFCRWPVCFRSPGVKVGCLAPGILPAEEGIGGEGSRGSCMCN